MHPSSRSSESCGIALVREAYIFIYFRSSGAALVSKNRTISQPEASPHGERYHITNRSIGAPDALQVPLVRFAALENHFCGHEQECARVYGGTLSANNPLKFSEEVSFGGLHGRIVELRVEDIKITGECYRGSGFRPNARMCVWGGQCARSLFQFPQAQSMRDKVCL
jgi:hypothetical protein